MLLEFQFTLPHSNATLPKVSYTNSTISLAYNVFPPVYTLVSSQYLQVPAKTYTLELDPTYEMEVTIRQHGLVIATNKFDHGSTTLEFTCNVIIPTDSWKWKIAPATMPILQRFMLPSFNDSKWSDYLSGTSIQTDKRVWLLRHRFNLQKIPSALGLYFEMQEGMTIYLNNRRVFVYNVNSTITTITDTAMTYHEMRKRGRAVLGSVWLHEGWNVLAIACTSSTQRSSVVFSLFSLLTSNWDIETDSVLHTSTGNQVRLRSDYH